MAAFEFRMERVLRVRSHEEELARADWLAAEQAARTAVERASQLRSAPTDTSTKDNSSANLRSAKGSFKHSLTIQEKTLWPLCS